MTDKKTKETVKKSLFFKCDSGKVSKIVDQDYDFDVSYLLPKGNTKKIGGFNYGYADDWGYGYDFDYGYGYGFDNGKDGKDGKNGKDGKGNNGKGTVVTNQGSGLSTIFNGLLPGLFPGIGSSSGGKTTTTTTTTTTTSGTKTGTTGTTTTTTGSGSGTKPGTTTGTITTGGKTTNTTVNVLNIDSILKLFENADGIGGGCGLARLRPFFLGTGGIYKGDDKNPYISKLPSDAEVDKAIATGVSKNVRDIIVLAGQSKVSCT